MHNIAVGTRLETTRLVDSASAITFLGPENARVLSTPHMIGYMERTCRDCALPMLEPGYDTVGTHVDVYHLAASPMGNCVRFTAEIVSSTGRRVEFRVEAWDGDVKIGEGAHERAIVNVAKFAARLDPRRKG